MILQPDDFPLWVSGTVVFTVKGQPALGASFPEMAADVCHRLNRDHFAGMQISQTWGRQPEGFEKMLISVGEEGARQRREALNPDEGVG